MDLEKEKKDHLVKYFILKCPDGTSVYTNDKTTKLLELNKKNTKRPFFLKGGRGGFGNYRFKSSRNVTPRKSNPGEPGNPGMELG